MRKYIGLFLMVSLILSTQAFANRDENMEPAEEFYLQKGNPEAGKKAFMDLKCAACHRVQNDKDLQESLVASKAGPALGAKQAHFMSGWIANSIVSPSHTIAYGFDGKAEEGELSRMGDFTETMTVRQLMDLVAYIKSLDSKSGSIKE